MNGRPHPRPADLELLADPSDDVSAVEEVRIAKSKLEKRRVEKDREEVEDWFRDRDRRLAESRPNGTARDEHAKPPNAPSMSGRNGSATGKITR